MNRHIRVPLLTLTIILLATATAAPAGSEQDTDLIKQALDLREKLAGYRKVDVNRDGLEDYIVLSKKRGRPLSTEYLRVFLSQPNEEPFKVKTLMEDQNLMCSDVEFFPGPRVLSAIVSIWSPGGSGGGIPFVFFVLDNKFVTFTGFQQVGEQNFSILRIEGQPFLVSDTPITYHKCGVPFSPRTVYYGFSGNLFYQINEEVNQAETPVQKINQAAYHFIKEEYTAAAEIYHQIHETIIARDLVSDETIDLVVESLFYEAKSLELGGKPMEARETYRRLVDLYPEHWMSEAALGELEALGE